MYLQNNSILVFCIFLWSMIYSSGALAQENIMLKKQYNSAILYHTQGDYEEAIAGFSRVIAADPTFVPAFFFRGYSHLKLEKYKDAIADFKIASELDPQSDKAFFYVGKTYYNIQKYQDAIEWFDKALSVNPKHVSALNDRGMASYQLGYYENAVKSFRAAIVLDPTFAMAHNNLGTAMFFNQDVANPTKRDIEMARDSYSDALAADPTLFVARYNRAAMHFFLEDYDAALTDIRDCLKIQPDNAMCLFYSGVILSRKADYNAAIQYFEDALSAVPDLSFAYEELGNVYKLQENYDDAIETYQRAIALSDDDAFEGLMYYHQAVVYALLEDEAATYEHLKKAQAKKVFRDKEVFKALVSEPAFRKYRFKDDFKKIVKRAKKGKKINKFENSELAWFRLGY